MQFTTAFLQVFGLDDPLGPFQNIIRGYQKILGQRNVKFQSVEQQELSIYFEIGSNHDLIFRSKTGDGKGVAITVAACNDEDKRRGKKLILVPFVQAMEATREKCLNAGLNVQ